MRLPRYDFLTPNTNTANINSPIVYWFKKRANNQFNSGRIIQKTQKYSNSPNEDVLPEINLYGSKKSYIITQNNLP